MKTPMRIKHLKHRGFWLFLLCVALWNAMDTMTAAASTEFWPSAGFVYDVNGPWMFQFKETYYYFLEDSASNHPKSDISLLYEGKNDVYDIVAGFIYVDAGEETKRERRPYLFATFRGKLAGNEFADRLRIEYRDISQSSDYWRFRNKLTWNSVFEPLDARGIRLLNTKKYRPYIADEIFLSSNGRGFNQNRVYAGLHFKIVNDIGANVYYLLQSLENTERRWCNNNIIGAELTLRF
jgi:hypothetical protein